MFPQNNPILTEGMKFFKLVKKLFEKKSDFVFQNDLAQSDFQGVKDLLGLGRIVFAVIVIFITGCYMFPPNVLHDDVKFRIEEIFGSCMPDSSSVKECFYQEVGEFDSYKILFVLTGEDFEKYFNSLLRSMVWSGEGERLPENFRILNKGSDKRGEFNSYYRKKLGEFGIEYYEITAYIRRNDDGLVEVYMEIWIPAIKSSKKFPEAKSLPIHKTDRSRGKYGCLVLQKNAWVHSLLSCRVVLSDVTRLFRSGERVSLGPKGSRRNERQEIQYRG